MAQTDQYVDADIAAGKKATSVLTAGAGVVVGVFNFEIPAADDNGSVYRIFKGINSNLIPIRMEIFADIELTITSANLGIYEITGEDGIDGAVVDDNAFANAINFSSGFTKASPQNGLTAIAIDAVDQRIFELAGHTNDTKKVGYDIAFTTVAKGAGGTGTVSGYALFAQG